MDLFRKRKYQGLTHNPQTTALAGDFRTGRFVLIGIVFSQGRVSEARYRTFPCIFAIVACEWVCEWVKNRTWETLRKLEISDVLSGVGEFPLSRHFCCQLALDSLLSAATEAKKKNLL